MKRKKKRAHCLPECQDTEGYWPSSTSISLSANKEDPPKNNGNWLYLLPVDSVEEWKKKTTPVPEPQKQERRA